MTMVVVVVNRDAVCTFYRDGVESVVGVVTPELASSPAPLLLVRSKYFLFKYVNETTMSIGPLFVGNGKFTHLGPNLVLSLLKQKYTVAVRKAWVHFFCHVSECLSFVHTRQRASIHRYLVL